MQGIQILDIKIEQECNSKISGCCFPVYYDREPVLYKDQVDLRKLNEEYAKTIRHERNKRTNNTNC